MSEPPAQRVRHVLYIDDDEALAMLVAKHLRRDGFNVHAAHSAQQALDILRERSFDAVALDHFMPERLGLEVLPDIRALPNAPPVIYVTGSEDSRIAVAALKAGAADYVVKDVAGEFLSLLSSIIEQALQHEETRRAKAKAEHEMRIAREKAELLLREVNHRVANSLAMVASLVHLQEASVEDPAARFALAETQNRITAIAQVHRSLYTSDNVSSVSMAEYLERIVADLEQSLTRDSGGTAHVKLAADAVSLSPDKAVAVGVIITELVTNAFKYAYSLETPGPVTVRLARQAAGHVVLEVGDSGRGLVPGQKAAGTGLGMKIVRTMAMSLDSELSIQDNRPGTRVQLAFAP
jgi:two-component sensor histidine kinase/CheY-like chemotaxis protein